MRRGTKRKLKVYLVDAAMLFLAIQITIVFNSGCGVYAETEGTYEREIVRTIEPDCSMEYTALQTENGEAEQEPASLVKSRDWDAEEAEMLIRIAMAEAEGEGVEGKAYVMAMVLNRVWSDGFPGTIEEVIFQPGQFTPVNDGGRYWGKEPDEECYEAYDMVLHGWDESEGALYFCTSGGSSWVEENCEYLYAVGNHNFYK